MKPARLILLGLAPLLALPAPAQPFPRSADAQPSSTQPSDVAEPVVGSVDDALAEMVELERELEAAQQRQIEHEQQLLRVGTELNAVESTARTQENISEHGLELLRAYDERASRNQAELEQAIAAGHAEIEQRKASLQRARIALLAQIDTPGTPQAAVLPLALLDSHQRTRAAVASARILRAETQIADLSGARDEARSAAGYHGAFSDFSARQLRERHKQLAERVAALRTGVDQESQSVTQLAARRGELKNLIEKLSEQQAEADAAAQAAKSIATPIPTPPPGQTAQPPTDPALGAEPGASAALVEVGYEPGSEPLVSQDTAPLGGVNTAQISAESNPPAEGAEGTRQLFWRASPVGVRALVAGRVVFSGEVAGYRHLLILEHGDGWYTAYGNMIETALAEEEMVKAGTRLGTYQAGQGRRAEPFVFEVYKQSTPVMPDSMPSLATGWQNRLFETM